MDLCVSEQGQVTGSCGNDNWHWVSFNKINAIACSATVSVFRRIVIYSYNI